MGWANQHIAKLQAGETVQFRPRGHSMTGRVNDRALCTVAPVDGPLDVDDVVLCRVNGAQYLHLVLAKRGADEYQIGNNRGGVNGWINRRGIYGRLIRVEP